MNNYFSVEQVTFFHLIIIIFFHPGVEQVQDGVAVLEVQIPSQSFNVRILWKARHFGVT